ncbi:type II toxin-antitoxin system VapC family toxin [Sphingomonas sp. GB1N7]|uniref:type II toxin-antitoxin system VapC family toxin n=1 Tax=Parasphingomonas caseinilytica TaxID=3096158 RepID=UPI002FC87086
MISVDSSAILAILFRESDANDFIDTLLDNETVIAAPTLVEMRTVVTRRKVLEGFDQLDNILTETKSTVIAFDAEMAIIAGLAFVKYGKGNHPAKLNFGDCMAYALAKSLDVPLLYKGNDFAQTDIRSARA